MPPSQPLCLLLLNPAPVWISVPPPACFSAQGLPHVVLPILGARHQSTGSVHPSLRAWRLTAANLTCSRQLQEKLRPFGRDSAESEELPGYLQHSGRCGPQFIHAHLLPVYTASQMYEIFMFPPATAQHLPSKAFGSPINHSDTPAYSLTSELIQGPLLPQACCLHERCLDFIHY